MSLFKLHPDAPRTEEGRQMRITELGDLLGEQYSKRGKKSGFVKKKSFAPSAFYEGAQGVCPRYWWYAFNGAYFEYDNDAQSIASMAYGTEAGKRIASLFEDAGILEGAEVEARLSDPPVRGFIDLLVNWHGETVVGEVKTTKENSWIYRATTLEAPTYNMIQVLLYMHIMQIQRGFLIYENKNTQQFVTIPVVMNEKNRKFTDDLLEWLSNTYEATKEDTPPKRPFRSNNKICKGCPVQAKCWSDEDGKVLLPVLGVS